MLLVYDATVVSGSPHEFDYTIVDGLPNGGEATATLTGTATSLQNGGRSVAFGRPVVANSRVPVGATLLSPGDAYQTIITAAANGTAFKLADGTYTDWSSIHPKTGQSFYAVNIGGAVLDGGGTLLYAFDRTSNNVTIDGLVIRRYSPLTTYGQINATGDDRASSKSGWVVTDCDVMESVTCGVRIGHSMTLTRVRMANNRELNICGIGDDTLVDRCEIAYGRYLNEGSTDTGGSKFVLSYRITVRHTFIHDNEGPGLWFDIDNSDCVVEDCVVLDNAKEAVLNEIGRAWTVRRNLIARNGLRDPTRQNAYAWDSGVAVHASSGLQSITNNAIVNNNAQMAVVQQNRPETSELALGAHNVDNVQFRRNICVTDHTGDGAWSHAWVRDGGGTLFGSTTDLEDNRYITVTPAGAAAFAWNNSAQNFASWQGFGFDLTSTNTASAVANVVGVGTSAQGGGTQAAAGLVTGGHGRLDRRRRFIGSE